MVGEFRIVILRHPLQHHLQVASLSMPMTCDAPLAAPPPSDASGSCARSDDQCDDLWSRYCAATMKTSDGKIEHQLTGSYP